MDERRGLLRVRDRRFDGERRNPAVPSLSREGRPELRQGRVAIDTESTDPAFAASVLWMAFKKLTTTEVNRINPVARTNYGRERTIIVGPDAVQWARAGNAANVYYAPA